MTGPTARVTDPKDWATLIGRVGVPSIIALGLVWLMAMRVPEEIKAQGVDTRAQIDMHARETRDEQSRQTRLLLRICLNTANTPEERAGCIIP